MDTLAAILARKSIRAYTEQAVSHDDVKAILDIASHAPSGVNCQPWHVAVVQGQTKLAITEALIAARTDMRETTPDYEYYPSEWSEPYQSRRVECGRALYESLGITRKTRALRKQAWINNYHFFGAPAGLFFFIDRSFNKGSWVDMGMFIQTVMIAATAKGLATCPQAALADYPQLIRDILKMDEQYSLICGMSLGYADTEKPVNQYQLPRDSAKSFTRWYD